MAVKTIRLMDGVAGFDASGVHVLHLVRDPRAVVRSQLLMLGLSGFKEELPNFFQLKRMDDPDEQQTETRQAVGRM